MVVVATVYRQSRPESGHLTDTGSVGRWAGLVSWSLVATRGCQTLTLKNLDRRRRHGDGVGSRATLQMKTLGVLKNSECLSSRAELGVKNKMEGTFLDQLARRGTWTSCWEDVRVALVMSGLSAGHLAVKVLTRARRPVKNSIWRDPLEIHLPLPETRAPEPKIR